MDFIHDNDDNTPMNKMKNKENTYNNDACDDDDEKDYDDGNFDNKEQKNKIFNNNINVYNFYFCCGDCRDIFSLFLTKFYNGTGGTEVKHKCNEIRIKLEQNGMENKLKQELELLVQF